MLIKHMATGMSYESFGAEVNVGKTTIYEWEKQHPDWKEAKEIAMLKAHSFFEKRLIAKTSGQKFNNENFDAKLIDNSCLIFALKTRFHKTYGEKKEVAIELSTIQIDSAEENL
jgi:DNA-binding XRE family transcriptional regulator